MPQTCTPLASSAGSSAWCTTRPLRTTTRPDALAGLGRDRAAAGRRLVARLAHLVGGHRPEPAEVELADAAVAPDLLGRGRPLDGGEPLGRGGAPVDQPVGSGQAARRFGREVFEHRHRRVCRGSYPTLPSMLSSMSRDSSTAYSIGSVLVIGSMKPLTIIAVACCSVSPRLIR